MSQGKAVVVGIDADIDVDRQRWTVWVERVAPFIIVPETVIPTDLPDDVRAALLAWVDVPDASAKGATASDAGGHLSGLCGDGRAVHRPAADAEPGWHHAASDCACPSRADATLVPAVNRGRRFGRLVISTCLQSAGAPIIDGCRTDLESGRVAFGVAIKPKVGTGRALVIAWVGLHRCPRPAHWSIPKVLTRGRFDRA